MAETQPQNVAYPGLFKGTYYVDPAFTGLQAGSQSNPFTTIAAAFAAAVALALAGTIVRIPPGVTVTENVVFPATGGSWEIACDESFTASTTGPRITGTVTCDSSAATLSAFRLTQLIVNGAISGACSNAAGAELILQNVRHIGALTLTKSAGFWVVAFKGRGSPSPNKTGGSTTGATNVDATILAENWVFEGTITEGTSNGPFNPPTGSQWHDCQFGSNSGTAITINLNAATLTAAFFDCYFVAATTFAAGIANYVINVDGATLASLNATGIGVTITGTGVTLRTLNSNASDTRTVTNNVGSRVYGPRNAAGLWEVVYDFTLLVAGTLGLLQMNIIYTDLTGTLVTVPVGLPLDITGAVGTKSQGALNFQHNGAAAAIAYSLTGIVTPGAMSVGVSTAIQRRN